MVIHNITQALDERTRLLGVDVKPQTQSGLSANLDSEAGVVFTQLLKLKWSRNKARREINTLLGHISVNSPSEMLIPQLRFVLSLLDESEDTLRKREVSRCHGECETRELELNVIRFWRLC